eukprot:TRINITY_DN8295_c0_g1_i1.p1 TRINITY_DN8295_c0_g1~~TRINITY_DN8295_c0_g1_i1.p1  ORF type:complete len:975 (+),score=198.96 TRINITY_DN8295_c0_g1_i1:278-3202(+)
MSSDSHSPRRGKTGKDRALKSSLKSTKNPPPSPPAASVLSSNSTPDLPVATKEDLESVSLSTSSSGSNNRKATAGCAIVISQAEDPTNLSPVRSNTSSDDVTGGASAESPTENRGSMVTLSVHARYKELKEARKRAVTNPEEITSATAVNDEQKIALLAEHVKYVRNGFRMGLAEEGYSALREWVNVPDYDAVVAKKKKKKRDTLSKRIKGRLSLGGIFSAAEVKNWKAANVSNNSGGGMNELWENTTSPSTNETKDSKEPKDNKDSKDNKDNKDSKDKEDHTSVAPIKFDQNRNKSPKREKHRDKFGSITSGLGSPRTFFDNNKKPRSSTLTSDIIEKLNLEASLEKLENKLSSKSDSKADMRPSSPHKEGQTKRKYHIFGVSLNAELAEEEVVPPFVQTAITYLISKPACLVPKTFTAYIESEELQKAKDALEEDKTTLDQTIYTFEPTMVARLLIDYFDELPEPIFTHRFYHQWLFTTRINDEKDLILSLRLLFYSLPTVNRQIIEFMLVFIQKFKDVTRMSKIVGPCMLKAPETNEIQKSIITPYIPKEEEFSEMQAELLQRMVKHKEQFLLIEEQDFKCVLTSGTLQIADATPAKLIHFLLNPFYGELDYKETVLLTHVYFITPTDLTALLFEVFEKPPTDPWNCVLRLRSIQIVKDWFSGHMKEIVKDRRFVEFIKSLVEKHGLICTDDESPYFMYLSSIMQNLERRKPEAKRNISFFYKEKISKEPEPTFEILTADTLTVAQQLTLIDHDMLKSILTTEFLKKAFSKPELCPNFMEMADRFNTWSMWVPTEILKKQTDKDRANVIRQFVNIANHCRRLKNFNTCYAIVAGLGNSAISRLKQTWPKVSRKAKLKLQALLELFEMSYNFKNYREALRVSVAPIIPYLGIFPKDLTSIEENNPDHAANGHVNFVKMRLLYNIISQLHKSQHVKYPFEREPSLRHYLKNVKVLAESEAHSQSLILEPRMPT